jgi:penicillin amidase
MMYKVASVVQQKEVPVKRAVAVSFALFFAHSIHAQDIPNGRMFHMPGLDRPAMVTREPNGIPHVFALTTHDVHFLTGWLHAQDRLFQMDTSRRIASGTLSELVGTPALANDVQLRTFGLRRAAEATVSTLSPAARDALTAYTDGVNAWLQSHSTLPPEYGLLETTAIVPWTVADSLAVGKLIAFGLSFDLDVDPTVALISYQLAGTALGFDGAKLFTDTWRLAPFSAAATVRDAMGSGATLPITAPSLPAKLDASWLKPQTIELARAWLDRIRDIPVMQSALKPEAKAGSNEWAVAGRNTTTGNAMIANDPHLSLGAPPNFYPIALRVPGRLNVAGMGFPGAPFVIQGQNERIAWGSTVHPMDVTDMYQEQLIPDATSPSGFASIYKGAKEAVMAIPQAFRVNNLGNGVPNDLRTMAPSASVPQATLIVPRHGPIVQLDSSTGAAISIQYVGFHATQELEAFMRINEARNYDEFRTALQYFDFGSQNFAYADVEGNIAYFTSGELPLREDLQAGTVAGLPPYFIRNGAGGNEWIPAFSRPATQSIPYAILPYEEMPQVVNPSNGWFVNGNNDPTGHTLDNDPLNTPRPGGGILYLNPGYDGIRGGRITQLVRQRLANNGKISFEDMKAIQADIVLYDAQIFMPFITRALTNAQAAGANTTLAALGSNPVVGAVVQRLSRWDFSAPTGIAEGYDASDSNGALSAPSQAEIDNSVAATLYSAWRSKFMANTIDGVLRAMTMPVPPHQQALSALRFQLENFGTTGGRGASGVNFFNVPDVADAAARRDIIILKSVADAMTMLSGDEFAPAFNKSADLNDYRWGKLHRIAFAHLLTPTMSPGAIFGPPPFPSVQGLQGVAVDGGYSVVDASSHNPRATTLNGFMFGSGPNRRYVGEMRAGDIRAESSLPGGVSGDVRSPWFTNLLMPWLTNDTFQVPADRSPRIPWAR